MGKKWSERATISAEGYELRDPKLSIDSRGRIVVNLGGSIYKGKKLMGAVPHVSFSNKKGTKFSKPKPINIPDEIKTRQDWLWRLTWYNGIGYGGIYHMKEKPGAVNLE